MIEFFRGIYGNDWYTLELVVDDVFIEIDPLTELNSVKLFMSNLVLGQLTLLVVEVDEN